MQSRFVFVSLEFSSNIFSCLSLSRYILLEESQRHREIVLFTFTFFFSPLSSFNDRLARLKGKGEGKGFLSPRTKANLSNPWMINSGQVIFSRRETTPLYFDPPRILLSFPQSTNLYEPPFSSLLRSILVPPSSAASSSLVPRGRGVERGG